MKGLKPRALFLQGLLLLAVGLAGAGLAGNALENIRLRGIATGFGFMTSEAGFGILQHLIPFDESSTYIRVFVVGLLNTLLVSSVGIFLATALGFLIGIARLSSNWLVARLATAYIEIFRNVPLLLQIFFWYFGVLRLLPPPRQSLSFGGSIFLNVRGIYFPRPVPEPGFGIVALTGLLALAASLLLVRFLRKRREKTGRGPAFAPCAAIFFVLFPTAVFFLAGRPLTFEAPVLKGFNFRGGGVVIPELAALVFALTIYTAAFIAEIVRAGILSVDRGQFEAARSLGLSRPVVLRLVVIPQAWRVIVPPLTNQYLNLTKNSSLAAAIGYPDLVSVFAGSTLNQTGQAVEVLAITMGVYLLLSLSISLGMNRYNRRTALVGRT